MGEEGREGKRAEGKGGEGRGGKWEGRERVGEGGGKEEVVENTENRNR